MWRTPNEGKHRRIDIVVNATPEELPFARLGWIGSRLLNRMLRQQAQECGLFLSSHALNVIDKNRPLILTDPRTREVILRVPAEGETVPATVPYEFVRSEADILYILGECTRDFMALADPRNRNA